MPQSPAKTPAEHDDPRAQSGPTTASNSNPPAADGAPVLRRLRAPGVELCAIEVGASAELHVTAVPIGNEPPAFTVRRLAELLNAWNATVVRAIAFGPVNSAAITHAALRQSLDDPALPLTWVEGAACEVRPLAGIQVHAIAGRRVLTVGAEGKTVGRLWKDGRATHCVFSGLGVNPQTAPRAVQAVAALSALETELGGVGMSFPHVARTWFYLDDILDWYDEFNVARNAFFARTRLGSASVPASTGVSGRNPARSAVALAAWAVKPHNPATAAVQIVASPKQCPAPAYGSAFSRAVEIQSPGFRQLLISGTASIEPGGKTAHVGDVKAQIERTMEVIEAILASRGMTLANTTRATAYFRSGLDAPRFAEWLKRRELESLPHVNACCDICRDDLLFELELDAMATSEQSQ